MVENSYLRGQVATVNGDLIKILQNHVNLCRSYEQDNLSRSRHIKPLLRDWVAAQKKQYIDKANLYDESPAVRLDVVVGSIYPHIFNTHQQQTLKAALCERMEGSYE